MMSQFRQASFGWWSFLLGLIGEGAGAGMFAIGSRLKRAGWPPQHLSQPNHTTLRELR